MLTVTVKEGEYVMIGEDILIKYVKNVKNNSISMGVEAPRAYTISRGSLYEKTLDESIGLDPPDKEVLLRKRAGAGKPAGMVV